MAHGDSAGQHRDGAVARSSGDGQWPLGAVTTNSGRISVARRVLPERPGLPFSTTQLANLDEALADAVHSTGLHFSIYLGDLGEDTRSQAEALHAAIGARAPEAVLIAVSPGQRVVEIVTGTESGARVADRDCKLAVMTMVASFKEGDLADGLTAGLRMLTHQAAGS